MSHQRSTIRRVGVAVVLAVCLALPGVIWAGPPSSNPGQPFAEILAQIGILNDKLDDLLANGNGIDLRGVTQNWDKKLDATNGEADGCNSERFTCLWGNTAVRDNETGIVWDREPAHDTNVDNRTWFQAIAHCANREVGGRKGWHLPMIEAVASLVDTSGTGVDGNGNPVKLPDGHPFLNVPHVFFWSNTTLVTNPMDAWAVFIGNGNVRDDDKLLTYRTWCARGGQSYDGQDVLNAVPAN